jgi:hypothetical protein
VVRSGLSGAVNSAVDIRCPVPHLPQRRGLEEAALPDSQVPRPYGGDTVDNEQPDWNFWCFVTSFLELLLQVVTSH